MKIIPVQRKNYQVFIPPLDEFPDLTPPTLRTQANLNVVISTCDRPENYIHQTLASMYMGGFPQHYKLNLVVSGPDGKYLDCYRHHRNVAILPTPPDLWKSIQDWPKKFKASYNYWRCMITGAHENSLVFEDDVKFQHGWFPKLFTCITDIERDGYDKYILSLFPPNQGRSEKSYFAHPKMAWACSQGMYFPKSVRNDIAQFVINATQNVAPTQKEPSDPVYLNAYDMLIKEYVIGNHIPVFCTVEALVQHTGLMTAGGTGQNIPFSPVFHSAS